MPDRATHRSIAFGAALVIFVCALQVWGLRIALIAAVACLLGEVLCGPDRDCMTRPSIFTPQGWWNLIWTPYIAVTHHRSYLSHWPIVGAALRVAYMGVLVVTVATVAGYDVALYAWARSHVRECVAAYLGLEAAGVLHWLADRCP